MSDSEILYDKDIREPLFDFFEESYGKIRIIEEMNIGRVRSDIVMVTPKLIYGIEIKSDADTYTRLKKQVKNYDLYYDRNIIVVGSSHAMHVEEHVPDWWGIITVELDKDGKVDFYVLRETKDNPKVDRQRKITILWRPELANLLAINKLPKYKQKNKAFVQEKLLDKVPDEILWEQVYEELFQRDYNNIAQQIAEYKNANRRK